MSDKDTVDGFLARLLNDRDVDVCGVLADWLTERGDPRGDRLRKMWKREHTILEKNKRDHSGRGGTVIKAAWDEAWWWEMRQRLTVYVLRLLSTPPDAPLPRPRVAACYGPVVAPVVAAGEGWR